jgi:predicted secreted protein
MSTPMSIAVYFTIWWIVLFAILPFGVKSQFEAGATDIPPGADQGAPVAPMLLRKALWTTFVSALLFVALDAYMFWAG